MDKRAVRAMHIVIRDERNVVRGNDFADHVDCIRVGSSSDCDVYIPDIRIASTHFTLNRDPETGWHLNICEIPPDSPARHTRVFVNALDVRPGQSLRHNDEIMIAHYRLGVFLDDSSASAPKASVLRDAERIRAHPLPSGSLVRSDAHEGLWLRPGASARLTEFALAIGECQDLASLMDIGVREFVKLFSADRVWLGSRRKSYGRFEFVESIRSDGRDGGDLPREATFDFRCAERGQFICIVRTEDKDTESAMCAPLICNRGNLGMVYVENRAGAAPYGQEDLDLLTVAASIVAAQLERVVMEMIKLTECIAAGELSFMRELQARMDPDNVPEWEGLQLAVYCKPGLEAAGDVYDVMGIPNGLAAMFCGHVTGAATSAALAMAEVRAAFRMGGLHADPPHVLLRAANWIVYNDKSPCAMDIVSLVMNPRTGAMQYATAGSIGAAVVDQRGTLRKLVQPDAPPVGSRKEQAYISESGRLAEGESLILYTPGTLAVTGATGEVVGEDRLLEAFSDGFGQSASAVLADLLSELSEFFKKGRLHDDICIMVLHRA